MSLRQVLWRAIVLAIAIAGLAACGDDGEDDSAPEAAEETTASDTTESETAAAQEVSDSELSDLEYFLMEKDEEPGFTPEGKPFSDASVEEFVSGGDLTMRIWSVFARTDSWQRSTSRSKAPRRRRA